MSARQEAAAGAANADTSLQDTLASAFGKQPTPFVALSGGVAGLTGGRATGDGKGPGFPSRPPSIADSNRNAFDKYVLVLASRCATACWAA